MPKRTRKSDWIKVNYINLKRYVGGREVVRTCGIFWKMSAGDGGVGERPCGRYKRLPHTPLMSFSPCSHHIGCYWLPLVSDFLRDIISGAAVARGEYSPRPAIHLKIG